MHISAPFIRRRIATSLLSIAILLAGGVGFYFLPVAALPRVDFPTIYVRTNLPGASPETMASSVATPLERQFGRIAGVTQMTSTSQLGATGITLQFDLDRDINAASRDVQAAINAAAGQLPAGLPSLPTYRRINPAEVDILDVNVSSDTVTRGGLYDLCDSFLAQKIAQVPGVGQVRISGGAKPAVRVDLNPNALAHYGIGLEEVRAALRSANANTPKGNLENPSNRWILEDTDQLFKPEQYSPLIIAYRNGAPVRLSDIAKVSEGIEDIRNSAYANGKTAVSMGVGRQPGANIIETVDRIMALLPELTASIPPTVSIDTNFNRTTTIRASVKDIEITMLLTVVLVVMVIFLFLRNAWATIIPSIAVPLSIVGTFGIMYLLHYSLDNLSLMALAICTGFVVDDAIVVIENISRYLEAGDSPLQAALKGSREIGFTVLSMSTSLIAVFIPILMMGGIVGRLFREFAVVLSVAIGVSLFVSLTTTPMMCALFLKRDPGHHGRVYRLSEGLFNRLLRTYDISLRWVLRHQFLILLVTIGTVCLNVYLFWATPKGFFPQQDTGRLNGMIQGDQDLSFAAMSQKMRVFTDIVAKDPAVDSVTSFTGGGSGGSTARMFAQLKPLNVRKLSADQVIGRIRRASSHVPGAALYLQAVQDLTVGGRFGGAQYQYTLQADNLGDLTHWAPLIQQRIAKISELRDVNSDQQMRGLASNIVIDRATAGRLGVAVQDIDNTLGDAFGQRQVSNIYKGLNQYHVVMEVAPEAQQSPDALKTIYVPAKSGKLVPLSAFAHYEYSNTPLSVNHQGLFPSITLSFNLAPGASLGPAVQHIIEAQRELGVPSSVHATFQGTAQAFQDSLANQPVLIVTALFAVYIVLGILYESFIHPITILSTLPSAGIGALFAVQFAKSDLNIIALIGIILLIGIVKKNAILMIDFAVQAERLEGKSTLDAIYQACWVRFPSLLAPVSARNFAVLWVSPLSAGSS